MLTLMMILTAQARSIDDVSQEDRLLVECEYVVQKASASEGLAGVAKAWKQCLENAKSSGLTKAIPVLAGRYATAVIDRDYGEWKRTNPTDYARVLLATAAQNPNTKFDTTLLNEQWHLLLADTDARNTLAGLLSIGIRWMPNSDLNPDLSNKLKAKLRRAVGDLGLKAPSENSEAMSQTDIMIMVQAKARHLPPEVSDERGTIYRFETQFTSQPLRFKARERRAPPIDVSHTVSGPQRETQEDTCIEVAAYEFSEALLHEVLRVAFSNYRIPAP